MNIVLEGPDASGKSTLARFLSEKMQRAIVLSEGPEKFPGEVNERIRRYRFFDNVIFDRHPAVSQGIYSAFNGTTPPDQSLVFDFYDQRPVLVYCVANGHVLPHEAKEHDSPEHLEMVTKQKEAIQNLYDMWAIEYAQFIYRVGTPMSRILSAIRGHLEG